ncbi:PfkB family carbohydrate kinase [Cerasicoccus fimbriatus]|uniref:PfkB family carbohydrate kinase n=1 Tax=Cerasicoccus fimbriatus TaxID=3014554 RepID=UPI0022B3E7EE|nr:PfkB family carbohydrate kinase [Cerasicoccus sp. TK19100]
MTPRERTLEELSEKAARISSRKALIGFDGFVDKIVHPVKQRNGMGEDFDRIETIAEFGARISAAAGQSANIEMYQMLEKLGGNGPIMANAMLAANVDVRYIGALGNPNIHAVFEEFAAKTNAVSVTNPGITTAAEFTDGKLMFGDMASLEEVDYAHIVAAMGEGAFLDACAKAHLIALVNWTMLPRLSDFFNDMVDKVLPNIGPGDNRQFFFDLADPAKRSEGDLRSVLKTITRFQQFGAVTLGLNYSEGRQVAKVLGLPAPTEEPDDLKALATRIRQALDISSIVVHPTHSAACATRDGSWWVKGPYCDKPKITTGAGDHFNAGYMCGRLIGLSPEACLTTAVSFSGLYVRSAKSPSLGDVNRFLGEWKD